MVQFSLLSVRFSWTQIIIVEQILTQSTEAQADYICKMIDRYQTHNIKSFAPRRDAIADFIAHKDRFMQETVWNDPCRSWYKAAADGRVTALWPGSCLHYLEAIEELRIEDWDVTYAGNRFAWLGNGYSRCEIDNTANWAYYIRNHDDDPPLARGRRTEIKTQSGTVTTRDAVSFSGRQVDEAKL